MYYFDRLGIGGIVFVAGALIYIVNFIAALGGRSKGIPADGVGLMVMGIGLTIFFRL